MRETARLGVRQRHDPKTTYLAASEVENRSHGHWAEEEKIMEEALRYFCAAVLR